MIQRWFVRLALACWPASWRRRHGRALAQTARDDWRRAGGAGLGSAVRRAKLTIDLAAAGLAERRRIGRGADYASRAGLAAAVGFDVTLAWRSLRSRPAATLAI